MSQTPEYAPAFVSVVNEFPEDLYDAMRGFVRTHPHWDQYRLMQVALAGFLFQQGSRERAVARHYLDGLFDRGGAAPSAGLSAGPAPELQPRSAAGEEAHPLASPASLPAPRRLEGVPTAQVRPHPATTPHLSRRVA